MMNSEYNRNLDRFSNNVFLAKEYFSLMTPESFLSFAKICRTVHFQKGKLIYSNGDNPRYVYILLGGKARIFSIKQDLSKYSRQLKKQEIFGLTETLGDLPYQTSVAAITACQCICIKSEELMKFLLDEPEVCFRLMKFLGEDLHRQYQKIFTHESPELNSFQIFQREIVTHITRACDTTHRQPIF